MTAPLLEVRNLRIAFATEAGALEAVRGVSIAIPRGRTVAVVGESGSGKSLTALAFMRLTPPGAMVTADAIRLDGKDISALDEKALSTIRGRRVAMIFQNPMSALNPVLTIERQIVEVLRRHLGLRGVAARSRALELLKLVEMSDPERRLRQYPHELSGGMQQRAMIAIALSAQPDLLIADEPTTALDVTLQAQIMELLDRLQRELGMALLLISHDLGVVAETADEVNVMYAGEIVECADARTLFRAPAHPYTRALLRTVRDLESAEVTDLSPIPGTPPELGKLPPGCPFVPRCADAAERCRTEAPVLRAIGPTQSAACHFAGDLNAQERDADVFSSPA